MSQISNDKLYFISSLDPGNQKQDNNEEITRTKDIFKLSSLFSEKIVLSDTQVVDNKGIKDLFLSDENFQDFFCSSVHVGMRKGKSSFCEVVEEQIEAGIKYSFLPPNIQKEIESHNIKNLDHLNRLYPKLKFDSFIKKLDNMYQFDENIKKIDYGSNFDLYPKRVENIIEKPNFIQSLKNPDAKKLCSAIMSMASREMELKKKPHITRSIFYSAIEKSPYSEEVKNTVKTTLIDRAYTENFWDFQGFNCLKHQSEGEIKALNKVCNRNYRSDQVINISCASVKNKLNLDDINFKFLKEFHSTNEDLIGANFSHIRKLDTRIQRKRKEGYPNEEIKEDEKDLVFHITAHINHLGESICTQHSNKSETKWDYYNLGVDAIKTVIPNYTSYYLLQQLPPTNTVIDLGTCVVTWLILRKGRDYYVGKQTTKFTEKIKEKITEMKKDVEIIPDNPTIES